MAKKRLINTCVSPGFFFLALLGFSLCGCESEYTTIPDAAVDLRRSISNYRLYDQGAYLYIDENAYRVDYERYGFGGVIIVHTYDPLDIYCAFDISCPNEKSQTVRISEPDDMMVCTCEGCGERYDLLMGTGFPMDGISNIPLKKYTVSWDDLYIYVNWL